MKNQAPSVIGSKFHEELKSKKGGQKPSQDQSFSRIIDIISIGGLCLILFLYVLFHPAFAQIGPLINPASLMKDSITVVNKAETAKQSIPGLRAMTRETSTSIRAIFTNPELANVESLSAVAPLLYQPLNVHSMLAELDDLFVSFPTKRAYVENLTIKDLTFAKESQTITLSLELTGSGLASEGDVQASVSALAEDLKELPFVERVDSSEVTVKTLVTEEEGLLFVPLSLSLTLSRVIEEDILDAGEIKENVRNDMFYVD